MTRDQQVGCTTGGPPVERESPTVASLPHSLQVRRLRTIVVWPLLLLLMRLAAWPDVGLGQPLNCGGKVRRYFNHIHIDCFENIAAIPQLLMAFHLLSIGVLQAFDHRP